MGDNDDSVRGLHAQPYVQLSFVWGGLEEDQVTRWFDHHHVDIIKPLHDSKRILYYAYSWQLNYPRGPDAYLANEWNQPLPLLVVWTYTLAMWFADGLVVSLELCLTFVSDQTRVVMATFHFLPWGTPLGPRLGSLFRISDVCCHDWSVPPQTVAPSVPDSSVFKVLAVLDWCLA